MKRAQSEHGRRAVFVMGMMAVAGVLIWSKLRLATNIPRSAYAVPEQVETPGAGTANPTDPANPANPAGQARDAGLFID